MSPATRPQVRRSKRRAGPADWQRRFMEQMAAVADVSGLAPSVISVFAWLIVSDPPHQTVEQMQEALSLSPGAISMATASLIRMGLVERLAQPGSRRLFYRFDRRGWAQMLRARHEATTQMRRIAEEALAHAPEPRIRLTEMRDVYAWFEKEMAQLLRSAPWASR
jgi:DNA-binding transcriptional regulator GbsR (MarR family)